jgi:hypothetical protein
MGKDKKRPFDDIGKMNKTISILTRIDNTDTMNTPMESGFNVDRKFKCYVKEVKSRYGQTTNVHDIEEETETVVFIRYWKPCDPEKNTRYWNEKYALFRGKIFEVLNPRLLNDERYYIKLNLKSIGINSEDVGYV